MLETLRTVATPSKTSAWASLRLVLWVHSFLWSYNLSHIFSIYPKELVETRPEGTSYDIQSAGNDEFVVRLATLSGLLGSK